MAYAALVSLANTIDLTLNHPKYSIPPREKDQIIRVKEYAILLQEFVEDFPEKGQSYEARIRELAQGAEDILEFSLLEHFQPSLDSFVVFSKITKHQHLLYINSYYQMNKVIKEIKLLSEKVMEIKNRIGDSTHVPSTSAPFHRQDTVRLDNNLMEVKLRLRSDSSELETVPIVGTGGIGKTTLARNVYDDPLITEHFDIRAWVTVSQDNGIQDIVSSLLVSTGDAKNQPMMQHKVHQKLKGRRYLIVLDDIWSREAWDELKLMFPDDGNGSRIMLTTRLQDVATYVGSFLEMRLMDEDESWDLLRQRVFKQDPCPNELEHIGKMIVRSCRGLPLAVVVISGLLAFDQTKAAWEKIAEDVKSASSANDEQIDKILSLSYAHLPHHLRPCFLYMAGFPEDYTMRASTLTKLWVAEGFLKPDKSKSFEETAEEYLEDLVNRSLFLVTKRKSNGRIKYLGIHDMIREMCIKKAEEENFILHVRGVLPQDGTRFPQRVSLIHSDLNFKVNGDASTVRTIICLKQNRIQEKRCSLEHFKLLRILAVSDASEFFFKKDSNVSQVIELFHLRYFACNGPFNFPESISNFQNLQTLIIGLKDRDEPFSVNELPVKIWRMPRIRHLLFYYGLVSFDEAGEFPLENLQTLAGVVSFVCSRKIVKMIPNLKKLGINYYTDWRSDCEKEYNLENLKYLQQLEILKIVVRGGVGFPKLNPDYPRTLKKLTLDYLRLSWEDMMNAVSSLPCLQVLKLRRHAFVGDTWETTEGGFRELRFLLIDGLYLIHWITETSHFPRLKCLVLHRCWRLQEIPVSIGEISTLELIEVDDENESLVRSAKQIQEDQRSYGNEALRVRVVKVGDLSISA